MTRIGKEIETRVTSSEWLGLRTFLDRLGGAENEVFPRSVFEKRFPKSVPNLKRA